MTVQRAGLDKAETVVGVLYGGMSAERPVSIKTGSYVARALRSRGWRVAEIDVGPDLPERLRAEGVTVAWLALHGIFGEDGCVQGLCEIMRIPYTGSGVRGSAMAMDKIVTKRLLRGLDIPMAADRVWRAGDAFPDDLPLPLMAKTPEGGSTIGTLRCTTRAELEQALTDLMAFSETVLLEQFIVGREITVAVLDGKALPVVEIAPESGFFDYKAKYTAGATRYLVPAPIPEASALRAQQVAEQVYALMELGGVARADYMLDEQGIPWFLEINTLPGMTATSLSPMAAGQVGMSFEDLVERILEGAQLRLRVAER